MPATITYEVLKRPADRDSYELHVTKDGRSVHGDLDEAYRIAGTLEPKYETAIRVTETTIHSYYL